MTGIVLEVIRAVIMGVILAYLWLIGRREGIRKQEGWWYIFAGFVLLFLGILVDVSDNFPSLNRYIIFGDREYQAFLEKVVGYLFGSLLLAMGFWKWMPTVIALREAQRALKRSHDELEMKVEERTDDLKAINEQLRQEIAERKQAEEALKTTAEQLTVFSENLDDMFFSVDVAGRRLLQVSPACEKLYGLPRQAFFDNPMLWQELIHPDDKPKIEAFEADLSAGKSLSQAHRIVRPDGEVRWVGIKIKPTLDSSGKLVRMDGIVSDVTQRKRAEVEITRLAAVVEQATETITITDLDGDIVYANPYFEVVTGYAVAEALGQNPRILKGGYQDHAFYQDLWDTITSGNTWTGVFINKRKDGSLFHEEATIFPIKDLSGKIINYAAAKRDITKRVQAEEVQARLEEELRRAHEQLQQELDLAAQVQTSLLPGHVPSLDGFDFAATALPARYVSGDVYDFILPNPETCHIVLADIAGKGVPAALLASTARTLLRAETEHADSPATILSSVNTSLYEDLAHAEMFITFFAARLDARLGAFTYTNAGHTETLWWQQTSRTCSTLPATSLPIGIYADVPITEKTIALRPGDVLVFYSDGITEAANPRGELFGQDRLTNILPDHAHLPASDVAQAIVEAVETFRCDAPLSDDLTLIVLKVLPRTISFTYPATLNHLNEVTALVQQLTSAYGSDFAYQMKLAASEIVTNVIQHAYRLSSGEMRGQITLLPNQVQLDLYDDGISFNPSSVPAPEPTELRARGRGLFVARQLTDELSYTPATSDGNHWRLVKLTEGE